MIWVPFILSAIAFGVVVFVYTRQAYLLKRARKNLSPRILVLGSRGKSGTVRLLRSLLGHTGTPTYAKITGTVAQEIDIDGNVTNTYRIGPVSASEMADVLIRADKNGAQAGVFECMAVAPKLIAFVQNKIVQAPIVIIPTIRLDHLEEEGDTLKGIAKNILSGLKNVEVLITGETNEEALQVMRWWCHTHHAKFVSVEPLQNTPVIPGHHPTNIETAIGVAHELGIDRSAAIEAISIATTEPDAEMGWEVVRDGHIMRLSDIGGANDPQSAAEALVRAQLIAPNKLIIPLMVNRWDRPLRTIAFAYSLRANPRTPHVGIIGPAIPQVRSALRAQGFHFSQIHHIGWRHTLTTSMALRKLISMQKDEPNAWFVMMENIHAFPADQIRKAFHKHGRPIRINSTHELGAENV